MIGKNFIRSLCCLSLFVACGAISAGQLRAPAYKGPMAPMSSPDSLAAAPFYSNLVVNSCTSCNYDTGNGYFVLGPSNCFSPGATQWIGYPFVAGHSGNVKRVQVSVTDSGFCVATSLKFNVAIFSDACTGAPGTLIAQKPATAPAAPCALATANFGTTGPALVAGTTYWVVCQTVGATEAGFTGIWWGANSSVQGYNLNDGNGWINFPGGIPGGFAVL